MKKSNKFPLKILLDKDNLKSGKAFFILSYFLLDENQHQSRRKKPVSHFVYPIGLFLLFIYYISETD